MVTVAGIRFREVGKIYYFDPGELELKAGDNVIVDTARGTEFGTVMIGNRRVEDEEIVQPLKVVRRKATADDAERVRINREKEKNAFKVCREKIKERGLEMKLISAEYTFDNAKILFYFTADGRVDFRELVKDLAAVFRIRIELRQVGVRDETKLMGGLGGCGRPLCCASYLSDFVPVSIRMAKEQNLSLNPQKISGVCGRLMCCLKNEADTYEDINTRIPKEGGKVITPDGREGIAETVNVLRERVRVIFTDEQGNREVEEFPAEELRFTPRRKPRPGECRNVKKSAGIQENDTYDADASELAAEADSETDPELKALVAAEVRDAAEAGEDDSPEENVVGGRKRRRRRRKPSEGREDPAAGSQDQRRTQSGREDRGSTGEQRRPRGSGKTADRTADAGAGYPQEGNTADKGRTVKKAGTDDAGDGGSGEGSGQIRHRRYRRGNAADGAGAGGAEQRDIRRQETGGTGQRGIRRQEAGSAGQRGIRRKEADSAGQRDTRRQDTGREQADGSSRAAGAEHSLTEKNGTAGSIQNPGQDDKNTHNNGTYRRFRKRRPKDNTGS